MQVARDGAYSAQLPNGCRRPLDLLISRLVTGRIVLSEATVAHAMSRVCSNWEYAKGRELWRGKRSCGPMMSEMTLVRRMFRDYARTLAIVAEFVAETRETVAASIARDKFDADTIEATCMCKYVCTGYALDCVSALRKTMGARYAHVYVSCERV